MMRWFLLLPIFFAVAAVAAPRAADAAPCTAANIRWAASSNNVYVMGAGTVCTLTELDALADKANIQLVDPANKIWLVGANIWLQQGARLNLHGSEVGGDVDELRLRSDSTVVFLRAYWGTLDIQHTKIVSWAGSGVDTDVANKRAHIQAKSFLEGETARESTMNIRDSEIGNLGFYGAESYGLSWKVLGSGAGLFDKVGVKGTVENSHIHHNYFGAYTWGADAMTWRGNEFNNNIQYGLDPHDNSDNLVIENNDFHHNGNHGLICSRYCDHLMIRNNRSFNNTGNGIMLHRLTNQSVVEGNEAYNNSDSGLAIFDSHQNTIRRNSFHDNQKGIRFSVGSSENIIDDNDIADNSQYGLYFFKGSDAPTEAGDGRPKRNRFTNNRITDNRTYGILLKEAPENVFTGNMIEDNGDVGVYVRDGSHKTTITNNIIRGHDDYGILIKSSNDTIISGNTFSNNGKNIGP
jgi:poly(beta-D-mannuronate) C5 epimerase